MSLIKFITGIIASVAGFVASVVFANLLGAELLGIYYLILAIFSWVKIAGSPGLHGALVKRLSEGENRGSYFASGVVLMVFFYSILILLILYSSQHINSYLGYDGSTLLILLLVSDFAFTIASSLLQGYSLVHIYGLASALKEIISTSIQVGLLVVGLGIVGMIVGKFLAAILISAIVLLYVGVPISRPKKKNILSLFDYAKFNWLGSVAGRSHRQLDIIILGFFVSSHLVGIYSVTWIICSFLGIFTSSLGKTIFPEFSNLSSGEEIKEAKKLLEAAISFTGIILIPGFIGSMIIGDEVLRLYGEEFVAGGEILVVLIFSQLIYSYYIQLKNCINGFDKPIFTFKTNSITIVSNVILNIFLVYSFGWFGAAIATTISAGIGLLIANYYLTGIIEFKIPFYEIFKQIIAAVLMAIPIMYISNFIDSGSSYSMQITLVLTTVTIGAFIYFSIYILISEKFRELLLTDLLQIV